MLLSQSVLSLGDRTTSVTFFFEHSSCCSREESECSIVLLASEMRTFDARTEELSSHSRVLRLV